MARSAKQVAAQRKASIASARARRGSSAVLKKPTSITTSAGTITYPAGFTRRRKSGGSLYKPFGT